MTRIRMDGLFWNDTPKVEEKRQPPEPVWLAPDYLPGLEESRALDVPRFDDQSLLEAYAKQTPLILDCECYPNYFLAAFRSVDSGRLIYFENSPASAIDCEKLRWIMENFPTISFNGLAYDLPMIELAASGLAADRLYYASQQIIVEGLRGYEVCRAMKVKRLSVNHVDLMPVAPLDGSLKIYAGRLHAPRMQDLPFPPETVLNEDQATIVRGYCVLSDLPATKCVLDELAEQLKLRERMSAIYGVDVRSKSDAQIAEAVIVEQIERETGTRPGRASVEPGTAYRYNPAPWLAFQTDTMREAFRIATVSQFVVGISGAITLPPALAELKIKLGQSVYQLGIGGLHSTEKQIAHKSDEHHVLKDRDVASYYPAIILNTGLYPQHLGPPFLSVYSAIVAQRLSAKESGDKTTADSLKITINGSFGKFGSMYSALYAPNLLIQVTVGGQLSLLMLIETLELAGIPVVSANTDGIVIKCPRAKLPQMEQIVKWWEGITGFKTEETEYAALYSRDVNNYLAVKPDGSTKGKGFMANPWGNPKEAIFRFHKNPDCQICVMAAEAYLARGVPIEQTVSACSDVRQFVTVRRVRGGAVKDGIWLGKAIRFYYAVGASGEIVYSVSGNKVPGSDGAKPLMDLPATMPADVDYGRYVEMAREIVRDLGGELPDER